MVAGNMVLVQDGLGAELCVAYFSAGPDPFGRRSPEEEYLFVLENLSRLSPGAHVAMLSVEPDGGLPSPDTLRCLVAVWTSPCTLASTPGGAGARSFSAASAQAWAVCVPVSSSEIADLRVEADAFVAGHLRLRCFGAWDATWAVLGV